MRSISSVLIAVTFLAIAFTLGCERLQRSEIGDATAHYTVDATWPQTPDDLAWDQTPGVTVDSEDNIYVFTRCDPAVRVYKTDGSLLRT
ncbi:MAG: hypothetical protein P8Z79_13760, partial [Sedimentisphaerales bacterium]